MTAKKVLVVSLIKTKAVLGAATRTASGLPSIDELVGEGLILRQKNLENTLIVPVEELKVTEADFNDEVFRNPLGFGLDASGTLIAPGAKIASVNPTSTTITVTATTPPVVPGDKSVVVVIDGGTNAAPLKFFGATAGGVAATVIPISGVPTGDRLVLASVDGYGSFCKNHTF